MNFAKTLLASVALCALCTAPALAGEAPHIHLVGIDSALKLKVGSPGHVKTNQAHSDGTFFTETITFSGSLPAPRVATLLWGETWQDTLTCRPPRDEYLNLPARTMHKMTVVARLSVGTSTGPTSACPSSTFTFYGPVYTRRDRDAKSDTFHAALRAKKYSGYNLTLNATTNLF